jgi:raffinose/stachyose/melibiose transport system substrate-binding protein
VRTIRSKLLLILAVMAMVVAACGGEGGETTDSTADAPDTTAGGGDDTTTTAGSTDTTEGAPEPVTIEWWHIQNNPPGSDDWQAMADEFMAANPHVTINITVQENEAFKAALQTALQAGDVPDLFQSWGGGGLREQVDAGLVQDITDASADFIGDLSAGAASLYQIDGQQYGIPYNIGMVGFWYNKGMFAEAGIDAPPTTWDELLADVQALKDAGITPIAVGAGDKWPAHFWYSYLMVRLGGAAAMEEIAATNDFSVPAVIQAGEMVQDLVELEPFQPGFLAAKWDAPDGEAGFMGLEMAAMDLMGQWAPGAFRTQAGVDITAGEELAWEIGWFPFPAVEGGAGVGTDAFGGGDGFAVGRDAPPEAVEFLAFITNADNQRTWATNSGLPVNSEAVDAVADPNMQMVLEGVNNSTFMQLYLDQFFTPEVGASVNDQTQLLFALETTPEEAASAITAVAGG